MNGTFVESSKIKANQARKDRFGLPDKKKRQKKEVLKKSTKSKFSKGVSPWLSQKKIRIFIIYVFWANQARKDRFFVILDKKILSTPEKETSKKVQKFEIFQEG